MEVKEFIKLEDEIKQILIDYKNTRNDDMLLYWIYCKKQYDKINDDLTPSNFEMVFTEKTIRKNFNLRSFETVSRCRRKIQEKCQELASDRTIQKLKKELEEDYKEYARL